MHSRAGGWYGISSCVLFWVMLALFAQLHPSYSHRTSAVSELGVVGAPHALWWNLLGFIVPGLLMAAFGVHLARAVGVSPGRGYITWLLLAVGLCFAGTGVVPGEMQNGRPDFDSLLTRGHIALSFVGVVPWLVAVFTLGAPMRRNAAWRAWRHANAAFGWAFIAWAFVGERIVVWPGLNQRIRFALLFGWMALLAVRLIMLAARPQEAPDTAVRA